MTFLATARFLTRDAFAADFAKLDFGTAPWTPKMLVLHNTGQPSLAQWLSGGTHPEQRLQNLRSYYGGLHWHSGPHWFVAPDGIWEFCSPLQDGVHCSCANHVAFGCEMVGDYAVEAFESGPGAAVRDNAVQLVATVFKRFGWTPDPLVLWQRGLAFHKDCGRDRHDCPGRNVDRAHFVARVLNAMDLLGREEPPAAPREPAAHGPPRAEPSVTHVQVALNMLGSDPPLAVDGICGPRTRAALRRWQGRANLDPDGELSPVTLAALDRALSRQPVRS